MRSKTSMLRPQTAAAVILIVTVLLAALVLRISNGGILSAHYNVTTREGRVEYLAAQGWTVDPQTETAQEITLPRTIDGVFKDYNALQRQQGFDLRPYSGLGCTVYTYAVTNYETDEPVLCTIYLYKNRVIAGDIHSTALDGFMHGIRRSAPKRKPASLGFPFEGMRFTQRTVAVRPHVPSASRDFSAAHVAGKII